MVEAVVAGLLAGFGIAVPVGAVGVYLVALTARTSVRVGLAAGLGVATADGVYALVAVVGGAAVAGAIAPFSGGFRLLAAGLLVAVAAVVAVRAVRDHRGSSPARAPDDPAVPPGRAYLVLLGMTLVNPMTVLYFGAVVLGDPTGATGSTSSRAAFVIAATAASASWQAVLVGGGAVLAGALTGARGRLLTALASAVLMCAFAVAMVLAA